MSRIRGCDSCGQQMAPGERRVTCVRCGDRVHETCRDAERICYQCRYRQARADGTAGSMLTPASAGDRPFNRI